jgi:putative methyltransferase (TIGR04325 family)
LGTLDNIKTIIKIFIPPVILKFLNLFRKKRIEKKDILFQETNLSWDDALKKISEGYSAENILIKCRDSLLKVKNGEYPYERDSVLFTEKEIFYPLLSSLLYISIESNNRLNIIDFGGSLGSTYFQNRDILKQVGIKINWNIIEQESFVKCGKEYFADNELHFFNNIDELTNKKEISACLFGSVLPYLKEPYTVFETIRRSNIKYVIIDRTLFLDNEFEDILTIQKVPSEIYDASYPAWFLSLNKFLNFIDNTYTILFKWDNSDVISLAGYKTSIRGFFLEKKV